MSPQFNSLKFAVGDSFVYLLYMMATVRELRDNTKHYLDLVESGESIEIYRNGKPAAIISPHRKKSERFNINVALNIPGASLSRAILDERAGK